MADVITRFKLETNQFDSALRNASNGLVNITKQLSLAGKDFDKFAQKDIEVARSLGQVESGANNLKDKLRDLVSAYNNVARAYNNLTKDQQQGDFGKAMAASLDQLQSRITQTKNELYGMSDSTKQAGTGLGSLNDIFGISITKLAGWGTAIAAAKGALDVAKDAFFQSETNIDDWGRTVEGAKGAYDVFLNTLNNGNWSNFFRNIETAINGAKDLYDALDRLSSIKSNNQAAIAIVQAEIQQLRVLKQQGKDVDDQIKQATQRLKALQSQSVNAGKTAGAVSMREVIRNQANSYNGGAQVSERSINAAIDGILKKGQAEFDKYRKNVEVFEKNPRFQSEVAVNYTTSAGTQTTYVKQFDINKLTEEQQRQYKLSKAITEGETRIQEGISIYAQAVQEGAQSAREEFRGNRYALQGNGTRSGSGRGTTGKTETELKQNEAAVAKLTEEYQKLATDAKTANDAQLSGIKERQSAIQTEIANLKTRNEELKKFAAEAQGIQVNIGVNSSLPDLTAKLKELQAAQSQALNGTEWQEYQKQIGQVSLQIDAMKGKWKDGMKATFTLQAPQDLNIPAKTVEFKADNAAVLEQLREVQGVTIDPKTLTVTANTAEAISALQQVEGLTIQPKQVEFKADNTAVLDQLREVQGVTIDDKTLTITANTADAIAALQQVEGLTIQPKQVEFKADNTAVLEQLREMQGVTIDEKTLTVTANTADAVAALQQVEGLTIQPKQVEFKADNTAVLEQLREVQGVTIDPKTLTVTANTSEAYNKVQELLGTIEGASVSFAVEPDLQVGTNIQSDAGISAYINMLKQQLQTADYGSALYQGLSEQLSDTTTLQSLVQESLKAGLGTAMFDIADELGKDFWTRAMEGGVENIEWDAIAEQINDARKAAGLDKIDFNVGGNIAETGKETKDSWNSAAQAVQNVGTALKSVEDPGAKIAGIIGQAIANIALGFAQASASSSKLGVFGWIAAVTGGLATMISTIAAIHSSTGYAEGGIIKGNSYSGDNLKAIVDGGDMVGLNAGEIVLNKAQTGNLASALQERDGNPSSSKPYVTGDTIVLGVNNWARKHGKGELVFTRG